MYVAGSVVSAYYNKFKPLLSGYVRCVHVGGWVLGRWVGIYKKFTPWVQNHGGPARMRGRPGSGPYKPLDELQHFALVVARSRQPSLRLCLPTAGGQGGGNGD